MRWGLTYVRVLLINNIINDSLKGLISCLVYSVDVVYAEQSAMYAAY